MWIFWSSKAFKSARKVFPTLSSFEQDKFLGDLVVGCSVSLPWNANLRHACSPRLPWWKSIDHCTRLTCKFICPSQIGHFWKEVDIRESILLPRYHLELWWWHVGLGGGLVAWQTSWSSRRKLLAKKEYSENCVNETPPRRIFQSDNYLMWLS